MGVTAASFADGKAFDQICPEFMMMISMGIKLMIELIQNTLKKIKT